MSEKLTSNDSGLSSHSAKDVAPVKRYPYLPNKMMAPFTAEDAQKIDDLVGDEIFKLYSGDIAKR